METRQEFLDEILEINSKYDSFLIGKAYDVAAKMHEGQLRKSGEPYLIHPMAVVKILAELGMDEYTLEAGLLHDVVEDTEYTSEMLEEEFGKEVALLVDGVTKISSLAYENKEAQQAETLRKMFLAMSKDIRVLIIKLADRLHNLRTINYMTPNKIREKCKETLDIYAPLASRLGIYSIKFELEDICMQHLWPDEYEKLKKEIAEKTREREGGINTIIEEINETIKDTNINYEISGRTKQIYSIFRKMRFQRKQLDEIFDLMAVRIIVDSVKDCYAILGTVHSIWTPIPGRFKDYIAMPKPNMYQSIHTTVIDDLGDPFEIQIRTKEMHQIAEYGIAAHWKYKEGISADTEEVKLSWLRQSLEWQKELDNPTEFLESLKMDLFENQVFVFTPKGRVMELPAGATPLDFAFKVHSEVGAKCVGAKINGKMVTIDHKLENGDIVEIVTSSNASGPSIDWLKIVKSATARTKIRQWLKRENKSDDVEKGKLLLDKYIRKKGFEPKELVKNTFITKVIKEMSFKDDKELFLQASNGGTVLSNIGTKLISFYNANKEKSETKESIDEIKKKPTHQKVDNKGVVVKGVDGLLVRLSKCCNPVPGDEIIGYITKGRGVSVHRKDCPNMVALPEEEKKRFIEVEWVQQTGEGYEADITIIAEDRRCLFSDISKTCDNAGTSITSVNAKADKDGMATVSLTVLISNTGQISKLMLSMKSIEGVYEVYRSKV